MTAWLISLRDRPIAESERTTAMTAVVVLILAAAILLTLARPHSQPRRSSLARSAPSVAQRPPVSRVRALEESTVPLAPRVARAADIFLAGYLGYLYGHAPASAIEGATPALLGSLRARQPRVSPSIRARRPRVMALHSTPGPTGLLGVSAVVNDGSLIDYPIELQLVPVRGRLLVNGLGGGY